MGNHRIRVRAPIIPGGGAVPMAQQRPLLAARSSAVSQQNPGRPMVHNNNNNNAAAPVKQVMQIRASSPAIQQQHPTKVVHQSVVTGHKIAQQQIFTTTASPATVQQATVTTSAMATTLAKGLPTKANVIVLHKNSPMAKTITTAARVRRSFFRILNSGSNSIYSFGKISKKIKIIGNTFFED